jgi:hypothetical protein
MDIKKTNLSNKKKEETMKKFMSLIVLLSLFVIGCSEQLSINSPVNTSTSEPEWLPLPEQAGLGVEKVFTISKTINGARSSSWSWSTKYTSTTGTIQISSVLAFPAGAFSGSALITQSHDDSTCSTTFGPSMSFLKPLTFTITYTGINVTNYDPADIAFAYLNLDGKVQFAVHSGITVDKVRKILKVNKAIIPHFSRYGFIRKSTAVVMDTY